MPRRPTDPDPAGTPGRRRAPAAVLTVATALAAAAPSPLAAQDAMLRKLTPILYVEAIEPVLPFWTERLGFEITGQVPEGDRLGFVMMQRDGVEVMLQTRSSVEADAPALADTPMGGAMLFIEVRDLDSIVDALEGAEILVPRRTTFYGADEIFVREPGGNIVGFAEFAENEPDG